MMIIVIIISVVVITIAIIVSHQFVKCLQKNHSCTVDTSTNAISIEQTQVVAQGWVSRSAGTFPHPTHT